MRFEGRVWQDGEFWLIEVPALDAMTQGRTKAEAYLMIKDLLETMVDEAGCEVEVEAISGDRFEVTATPRRDGRPKMKERSAAGGSQTDWERLRAMKDEDIDLSDIPEITEEQMERAVLRVGGKPGEPTIEELGNLQRQPRLGSRVKTRSFLVRR